MTATKQRKVSCVGYGDGAGLLHPCGSPALPVERSGRCIRCERLQRSDELAHVDPFVSVNDMALPGEGAYREMVAAALRPAAPVVAVEPVVTVEPKPVVTMAITPTPVPVAVKPWHSRWPACLLCGQTRVPHNGHGICTTCNSGSMRRRDRGEGVAVIFVPFAADPARYDHSAAKRWVVARDLAEAWAYLERRAAAGGITKRGKVVIRVTANAADLPEVVIRRAA